MKKTLFLILSGCIVIFSIICICCGPIITGVIPRASIWKTQNCQQLSDLVKSAKDTNAGSDIIKGYKKLRNKCNREKAMYGLEYSSLIVDVIFGFVCTILGLLHYFDVAKPFEKVTGIIGLATGIIGFVLTLVYVCYSGYIFTKDPYDKGSGSYTSGTHDTIYKRNGDWAFAKFEEGKGYKCLYYKEKDTFSIYAKYSDLGKKQYNYNKKKNQEKSDSNSDYYKCSHNSDTPPAFFDLSKCESSEYYPGINNKQDDCDYLYAQTIDNTIDRKYLFDKWVTTIIFSCFIIVCDIGLAIFGFLLFKSDGSGI